MNRAEKLAVALSGKRTYLQPEECAYPKGGQTRRGMAIYPDGVVRRVYAGIPDTYCTIRAHGNFKGKYVRGYLSTDSKEEYIFSCRFQ